jgi:hypothetical protein
VGSHAASKRAFGGHVGHADWIATKKVRSQPKSMDARLISHTVKAHHPYIYHSQHQLEATAPVLTKQHGKAVAAGGVASIALAKLMKFVTPKQHASFPAHKAEGGLVKPDTAKLTKVAATKQHSTFPLHKDGRAIQSPVKWEGFNPRHASEILEVLLHDLAPDPRRCH